MDKLLLTPLEAAEALSIGRSKLYELLAEGRLDSVRVGSCRRIPIGSLTDFVTRLQNDGDPAVNPDVLQRAAPPAMGAGECHRRQVARPAGKRPGGDPIPTAPLGGRAVAGGEGGTDDLEARMPPRHRRRVP